MMGKNRLAPDEVSSPQKEKLAFLKRSLQECRDCGLADGRNQVVFGEGSPSAAILLVGEGPGREEDKQGKPFVGAAGTLLDKIMASVGFSREELYIANVVKCRPPGNRVPSEEEAAVCLPKLWSQIEIINPKIIILLGSTALKAFTGKDARITRERGKWLTYKGIRVMPTYHPAALLRDPAKKRPVWEDMKAVRAYYNELDIEEARVDVKENPGG